MSSFGELMSTNWADVDDKPNFLVEENQSILRKSSEPVDFKKLAEDSQDGFNLIIKQKFSLNDNDDNDKAAPKAFSATHFSKSPQTPKKSPKIGRKRSYSSTQSPSSLKQKGFINSDKSTVAIRKLKVSRVSPGKSFASALLGIAENEREQSRRKLDFSDVDVNVNDADKANDGFPMENQDSGNNKAEVGPTSFAFSFAEVAKKSIPQSPDKPPTREPIALSTPEPPVKLDRDLAVGIDKPEINDVSMADNKSESSDDSSSDSGSESSDSTGEKKARSSGPQVPLTEDRIAGRRRMIEIMKASPEYLAYSTRILPDEREPLVHPSTPDVHDHVSKRRWNGRVIHWKKRIHRWADEHPQYFTIEEKAPAAPSSKGSKDDVSMDLPKPPTIARKLIADYEAIIEVDRLKEQQETKRAKKALVRTTKGKKKQKKAAPNLVVTKSVEDDAPREVNVQEQ